MWKEASSGGFCATNWMPHSCLQVSTSEKISLHLSSLLGFSATAKDSLSMNAVLIFFQRHQGCYLAALFANWHSSEQGIELWGNKPKAYHFIFSSLNLLSSCGFHFDVCPQLRRRRRKAFLETSNISSAVHPLWSNGDRVLTK